MNRRVLRLLPIALVITSAGILFAPVGAHAAPIDDKQAQANQLSQQINDNATRLAALDEQINSAQNDLAKADQAIHDADAMVAAAQAKTKQLRAEVAKRAAVVYTQSGSTSGVAELDAQSANDLTTRQKYTSVAEQRDAQIVSDLARAKEQLALRKADAEQARQAAQAQSDAIQVQKDKLASGNAALQKLYSQVKGEIADLVAKADAERQAQQAAAARAEYDLQVSNAAKAAADAGTTTASTASATPPPAPNANVAAVLAYAYAQLGKPYCYAGVGPDCFDCSGLSMMAWAQAGVAMPHGSYAQQAEFPAVSMDQLQPGDLVFWAGHVGIYVGDGSVLHAPHTGTVVQITPIWPGVIGAARP